MHILRIWANFVVALLPLEAGAVVALAALERGCGLAAAAAVVSMEIRRLP